MTSMRPDVFMAAQAEAASGCGGVGLAAAAAVVAAATTAMAAATSIFATIGEGVWLGVALPAINGSIFN